MAFDELADLLEAIALIEARLSRDPEEELALMEDKVTDFAGEVGHLEGELLGFIKTRGDYETPDKEDDAIEGFYQRHAVMTEALNVRRDELRLLTMEQRTLEGRLGTLKRLRARVQELRGS